MRPAWRPAGGAAGPSLLRLRALSILFVCMPRAHAFTSQEFADDLEQCIKDHATEAAASVPIWGSACMPPTEKIDYQAAIYTRTLASIRQKYGYTGALWCAFYSVRMTGKEFDPNSDQPNNRAPPSADFDPSICGASRLAAHLTFDISPPPPILPIGTRACYAHGTLMCAAPRRLGCMETNGAAYRPSALRT